MDLIKMAFLNINLPAASPIKIKYRYPMSIKQVNIWGKSNNFQYNCKAV